MWFKNMQKKLEMTMKKQKFTTLDIHLAAFLEFHGLPSEFDNQNGRIIFTFPVSNELYALTSAFNSNESVPVTDYVSALRTLKARMYSMRGQR